jgi:hypothetical protein
VLDWHCADLGRDPSEIRRSVQIRVPDTLDGLHEQVRGFVAVGVTEFILIVTADPVAQAERVVEILPRLRALAPQTHHDRRSMRDAAAAACPGGHRAGWVDARGARARPGGRRGVL